MRSKKELLETKDPRDDNASLIRVPGIEAAICELRLRYPGLTDEAIARILGLPSDQISSTSSNPGPDIPTTAELSENNR